MSHTHAHAQTHTHTHTEEKKCCSLSLPAHVNVIIKTAKIHYHVHQSTSKPFLSLLTCNEEMMSDVTFFRFVFSHAFYICMESKACRIPAELAPPVWFSMYSSSPPSNTTLSWQRSKARQQCLIPVTYPPHTLATGISS